MIAKGEAAHSGALGTQETSLPTSNEERPEGLFGNWESISFAFLLLATVIATVQFLRLHAAIAPTTAPTMAFLQSNMTPTAAMGWWGWWDQGWYQKAAVAWAHCVTDPSFHWYLPGYALLGAMFVHLTPADPFMVPNLACLIGTLWLFCLVADRLLHDVPLRIPLACCAFTASTVIPQQVLWSWVVPLTTTPETLCLYSALFGSIRLIERAERRDAFLTGLASAAIAGFRPVDAVVAALLISAVTLPVLLLRHTFRPSLLIAAVCGGLLPLLVFGAAYLEVWGPRLSRYLLLSEQIGFEPRLLALRWVTLMIDPRPLHPDGAGLATVFFWIMPGFAGIAATLIVVRGTLRPVHILVVGIIAADLILFLIYRDLHPTGLWQFRLYHYFKWMLPLFALYAFRLALIALVRDSRRPVAVAVGRLTIPLLFFWRVDLLQIGTLPAGDGSSIMLATGLSPIDSMVLVPAHGAGTVTVIEGYATTTTGSTFRTGLDFTIYNTSGLLRIVPLRPLPPAATVIRLAENAAATLDGPPIFARQSIHWGLPFWITGKPNDDIFMGER